MLQSEVVPAANFRLQDWANESLGLPVHREVQGHSRGHSCHRFLHGARAFRAVINSLQAKWLKCARPFFSEAASKIKGCDVFVGLADQRRAPPCRKMWSPKKTPAVTVRTGWPPSTKICLLTRGKQTCWWMERRWWKNGRRDGRGKTRWPPLLPSPLLR